MLKQKESLYAAAHEAFWDAKAKKYLKDVEHGTVENAFIGYVILDWLQDINTRLGLPNDEVIPSWDSFEYYDQWLLRSMLRPEEIIKQVERIYRQNEKEILDLLGNNDPSYVNDFSADFYYCNGMNVPTLED